MRSWLVSPVLLVSTRVTPNPDKIIRPEPKSAYQRRQFGLTALVSWATATNEKTRPPPPGQRGRARSRSGSDAGVIAGCVNDQPARLIGVGVDLGVRPGEKRHRVRDQVGVDALGGDPRVDRVFPVLRVRDRVERAVQFALGVLAECGALVVELLVIAVWLDGHVSCP